MDYGIKAGAAAIALTAMLAATPAQAAKVCKPGYVSAQSTDIMETVARTASIAGWSAKAAQMFTPRYANWANASSKSTSCRKFTSSIGANAFTCFARARACAYQ